MDSTSIRIAILGTGLIGGSLGLALKERRRHITVVGLDEPSVLEGALARGAIDLAAADPASAVQDADVVILATPLATSLTLLSAIAPHLKPGAVVSDVGSVKTPIMQHAAEVLPAGVNFVGGHPMTGSEQSGIGSADALLFENAVYVLCPSPLGQEGFDLMSELVGTVGARVMVLDADVHDSAAARISHLPQLLAIGLVQQLEDDAVAVELAAGGFRDMTRIASSSFGMWKDILAANQGAILDELGRFAASLQRIRNRIAEGDLDSVGQAFENAADIRSAVPVRSKGFLNPLLDVFVYTRDERGALRRMTVALDESEVDVKDIELLKIREGTGGTFRLGFAGAESADAAVLTLNRAGFHAYRL